MDTRENNPFPEIPALLPLAQQAGIFLLTHKVAFFFGFFRSVPSFVFLGTLFFLPQEYFSSPEKNILLFGVGFFFLGLFWLFGESGLILLFQKKSVSLLERLASIGALAKWYFVFLLVSFTTFTILFFPSFLSTENASHSTLLLLAGLFFLLLFALFAFLKNIGIFYLLLSRLSISHSITLSYNFFLSQPIISLFDFGIFSLLLSFFLSFIQNIIFSTIPLPFLLQPFSLLSLLVLFFLLLFGNTYFPLLWYFFFEQQAKQSLQDWQNEKEMVQKDMSPVQEEA